MYVCMYSVVPGFSTRTVGDVLRWCAAVCVKCEGWLQMSVIPEAN